MAYKKSTLCRCVLKTTFTFFLVLEVKGVDKDILIKTNYSVEELNEIKNTNFSKKADSLFENVKLEINQIHDLKELLEYNNYIILTPEVELFIKKLAYIPYIGKYINENSDIKELRKGLIKKEKDILLKIDEELLKIMDVPDLNMLKSAGLNENSENNILNMNLKKDVISKLKSLFFEKISVFIQVQESIGKKIDSDIERMGKFFERHLNNFVGISKALQYYPSKNESVDCTPNIASSSTVFERQVNSIVQTSRFDPIKIQSSPNKSFLVNCDNNISQNNEDQTVLVDVDNFIEENFSSFLIQEEEIKSKLSENQMLENSFKLLFPEIVGQSQQNLLPESTRHQSLSEPTFAHKKVINFDTNIKKEFNKSSDLLILENKLSSTERLAAYTVPLDRQIMQNGVQSIQLGYDQPELIQPIHKELVAIKLEKTQPNDFIENLVQDQTSVQENSTFLQKNLNFPVRISSYSQLSKVKSISEFPEHLPYDDGIQISNSYPIDFNKKVSVTEITLEKFHLVKEKNRLFSLLKDFTKLDKSLKRIKISLYKSIKSTDDSIESGEYLQANNSLLQYFKKFADRIKILLKNKKIILNKIKNSIFLAKLLQKEFLSKIYEKNPDKYQHQLTSWNKVLFKMQRFIARKEKTTVLKLEKSIGSKKRNHKHVFNPKRKKSVQKNL